MKRVLVFLALAAVADAAVPAKPSMTLSRKVAEQPLVVAGRTGSAPAPAKKSKSFLSAAGPLAGFDVPLLMYFVFWYVGNAIYNLYNTMALTAVGGKHSGLTMTVSTLQLGVCTLYAGLLWLSNFNPITLLGFQSPSKMPLP